MKKILLDLILLLLIHEFAPAQQKWFNQCLDPNDSYYSIHFADSLNGWIGANNGHIYHTTDGGNSWALQQFPRKGSVSSLHFFDANTGWAISIFQYHAGSESFLGYTTDGGNSWQESIIENYLLNNTGRHVLRLSFYDRNNGVIAGVADTSYISNFIGTILNTSDGGKNWSVKYFSKDNRFDAIDIVSPDTVFALTYDKFVSTYDSGNNWNITDPNIPDKYYGLKGMSFINRNEGWLCGMFGRLLKTTNAGSDWIRQKTDSSFNFTDIYFKDNNNGWAIGYNPILSNNNIFIINTTDGGNSWANELVLDYSSIVTSYLRNIYFSPSGIGWSLAGSLVFSTKPAGFMPKPLVIYDTSARCEVDSVLLSAWPQGQEFSYLWSTGQTTPEVMAHKGGIYSVKVMSNFGQDSAYANVHIYPRPEVRLNIHGKINLCYGDSITLRPNVSNYCYWPDGSVMDHLTVSQPGKYWVLAADSTGCYSMSDTVEVTIDDKQSTVDLYYNPDNVLLEWINVGQDTTQTIEVTNNGNDVTIDSILVSKYSDAFSLTIKNKFPFTLKKNDKFTFDVTFRPKYDYIYMTNITIIASSSCTKTYEIPIEGDAFTVSVYDEKQFNTNNSFRLYPNPAKGELNIIITDKTISTARISIINQMGQSVMENDLTDLNGNLTVDIGSISPGIYYCRIVTNQKSYFSKFIVIN